MYVKHHLKKEGETYLEILGYDDNYNLIKANFDIVN